MSQGTQWDLICLPGRDPYLLWEWGAGCALVFLVPDLDILPGTEVARYLNQQSDGQTYF
jgi:hypothetical protein